MGAKDHAHYNLMTVINVSYENVCLLVESNIYAIPTYYSGDTKIWTRPLFRLSNSSMESAMTWKVQELFQQWKINVKT